MPQPITPQQEAADIYWQEIAPDDYELLLQADLPEDENDDTIFLWLLLGFIYLNTRTKKKIPAAAARDILDRALANSHIGIDVLGQQLIDKTIKPAKWHLEMSRIVEEGNLSGGAAARGGWGQLTGADLNFIQDKIDDQLTFLDGFRDDIKTGKQPLNGNFMRRARMYGDAPRSTYEEVRGRLYSQSGYNEEARELGIADHCPDCVEWDVTSLGWVPIGTAPQLFTSVCRTNCHCNFIYRNTATGEIGR